MARFLCWPFSGVTPGEKGAIARDCQLLISKSTVRVRERPPSLINDLRPICHSSAMSYTQARRRSPKGH